MSIVGSKSEDNGLELLTVQDKLIYSVGVSTGGLAEIRMVQDNPNRHVIATTIDERGVQDAASYIKNQGLDKQIELRLEDVSEKLQYKDNVFDFIYARLVLHYLSKTDLSQTLKELYRVLKPGKILYVVVRSAETKDATNAVKYDADTGFSYYHHAGDANSPLIKRFFHSEDSIKKFLTEAGFRVEDIESYEERLYTDFMRAAKADHNDMLIEVRARK